MIDWFVQHYHWQGLLVHIIGLVLVTKLTWWLAFKLPVVQQMRQWNRAEDKPKKAKPKYRPIMKQTQKMGMITHLIFFLLLVPFVITLDAQPWWKYFSDALLILLVYDFLYYLTHRFIFHGELLKRVHGLHHQARDISYIDSQYVHPLETLIGTSLFMGSAVGLSLWLGDFHALTFIMAEFIFNNVNQINHTKFNVDRFPYKIVNYITTKHATHHIDMKRGNYSTLSPLYDWMFGTLE
tara:strand:- start:682 stop:1395 length:714 start_codon:yes stop_codon:yes gene_type:complete